VLKLCLAGVVIAAVLAFHSFVTGSETSFVLAAGLSLASIEVALLYRVAKGFTATIVPVLSVNVTMLGAMLLWDDIRAESIVSIRFNVPMEYHYQAAWIGIIFTAALTAGALLAGPRSMGSSTMSRLGGVIPVSNMVLVISGYAILGLTIYARQGALLRGAYLQADGPEWALKVSNALIPLALLAFCIAAARPGKGRILASFGIGLWTLIMFGRASRAIAALPSMLILGKFFAGAPKIRTSSVVLAVVATFALLQLPLALRLNSSGVGVYPLWETLVQSPGAVFEDFSLGAILGNILFSGPLTAVVALKPIDMSTLWVSISPMPGFMTDWPIIGPTLRLSVRTPYNALGELASLGWLPLALVAGGCGFALSMAGRIASGIRGGFGGVASVFTLAVTAFFSVSILQYNLRSSVRLVWYVTFVVIALAVLSVFLTSKKEERRRRQELRKVRAPQ
jgi:hypothetical protein